MLNGTTPEIQHRKWGLWISIKIPSLILGLIQTAYYLYALYVVSLLDGYDMDHVLPDISSLGPSMFSLNNFSHQICPSDLPVLSKIKFTSVFHDFGCFRLLFQKSQKLLKVTRLVIIWTLIHNKIKLRLFNCTLLY